MWVSCVPVDRVAGQTGAIAAVLYVCTHEPVCARVWLWSLLERAPVATSCVIAVTGGGGDCMSRYAMRACRLRKYYNIFFGD